LFYSFFQQHLPVIANNILRFVIQPLSVLVTVIFLLMSRMLVLMRSMLPGMVMPMLMFVHVAVAVFVLMLMTMLMLVLVFMIAFHISSLMSDAWMG
jgi:hypothetical protein